MHLYIHIPFCKQACHYCDFHFSTRLGARQEVVEAICREIELQRNYLRIATDPVDNLTRLPLETAYFGGGTPSLLEREDLQRIFEMIDRHYSLLPDAEVTLEANPDDLSAAKLSMFREFPINRLSIGIQSFHGPHLERLNRAHTAGQAEQCVRLAQEAGFHNLSIDLIYAIPAADHSIWQADLEKALALNVSHISSYCLTIEPQTAFGNWLKRGRMQPIDEEFAARQFEMLVNFLTEKDFEQYEISNFARPGWYARHNSSYWKQHPYLGVGPSAHSYNGTTRQYNVANNTQYMKAIAEGRIPCTVEELSVTDRVNEYMLTSLRTQWGCDTTYIRQQYGVDLLTTHRNYLQTCLARQLLTLENGVIRLTLAGRLLADQITSDLFLG